MNHIIQSPKTVQLAVPSVSTYLPILNLGIAAVSSPHGVWTLSCSWVSTFG